MLTEKYEIFMNIASIDIGTNTVLLLIAEVKGKELSPILNEYRIPRIGKGLLPGQPITSDRIQDLYKVLEEFITIIRKNNCSKVIVKATNAFRIASNSEDIIKDIQEKLNLRIEIIPGTEEAVLSYFGAISASTSEYNIVIDIGGGSTEIIYGTRESVLYSKSFQAGVVSFTEKYFRNDPPTPAEIKILEEKIKKVFSELDNAFPPNTPVIGVAGTPTTLSCIQLGLPEYDEEKIEQSILTISELESFIFLLGKLSSKELLDEYGYIVKGREDLLLTGTLILLNLLKLLGMDQLIVSSRGIRFGAIIEYINNSQ